MRNAKGRSTRVWVRVARTLGLALGVSILYLIGYVMWFEDSLIYFPTKGGVGPSPGRDLSLAASDGVKLHAWHVTHPQARVTLLWLHGNAGNLEDRRDMLAELRELPANVLILDYRGYGKSEGKPSEEGVYRDARAAYDWLAQSAKIPAERIVVFGKSLGGAVACQLASQVPAGGLVVQSSFTSAGDMASRVLPIFPARWLIHTKFDSLALVAGIRCPKLFIHTEDDEMIPFTMGRRLYEAAAEPKEYAWFKTGGHNGVWIQERKEYYARLARFLERVAPQR